MGMFYGKWNPFGNILVAIEVQYNRKMEILRLNNSD